MRPSLKAISPREATALMLLANGGLDDSDRSELLERLSGDVRNIGEVLVGNAQSSNERVQTAVAGIRDILASWRRESSAREIRDTLQSIDSLTSKYR